MARMIIIFFCLRLSSFLYATGHDCLTLPRSMNKNRPERGCAGAVWHNGDPSSTYCKGIHWNGTEGVFPWWSTCCFWNGNSCHPNSGKLYVYHKTMHNRTSRSLLTSKGLLLFFCNLYLQFIASINLWNKCIDLRLFLIRLKEPFLPLWSKDD